jgi:ATP-dependent DNA ligase
MDLYDDKTISPMLLFEIKEPFDDENYLFELKFDGIRALIFVEPHKILIKNRNGIILNRTFPELLEITKVVKHKCIFDGEIVVVHEGRSSFKKLQQRALLKDPIKINYMKDKYPVIFICFDILYDKEDLTKLSLIERKKYLERYEDNDIFVKTKYYLKEGINLFNNVKKMNLEGIIAKEIHSKYKINKRSKDWVKIKNLKDGDFYVGGYKEDNEGSLASLILGSISDNEYIYIGNVSIGKNNPDFKLIKKCKKLKSCPFKNFKEKGYTFIAPELMVKVEFIERTETNSLRQPIYKSLK